MKNKEELHLEEESHRFRLSGMFTAEIVQKISVDPRWTKSLAA